MKITEFLKTKATPLQSVEADKETAGRLVCEAVGRKVTESETQMSESEWFLNIHMDSLDIIYLLEAAVIEKTSNIVFANALLDVLSLEGEIDFIEVSIIARVTAIQRLTACLITLAELEKEQTNANTNEN